MNINQKGQKSLFEDIKNAHISDFGGFVEETRRAVGFVAEELGITKVDCVLSVPQELSDFGNSFSVYGENGQGEPIKFSYDLSDEGNVEFLVYTNDKGLSDEETEILEIDLRQLSYILDSLILKLKCEQLSLIDFQTGISNTKAFMSFASKILDAGKAEDYTAIFFNIRNFKSVHRSLTYLEGNKVLKKYSRIVAEAVTEKEMVARSGGDNFIALILNDNLDYFFDLLQNMVIFYEKDGRQLTFMFGAIVGALRLTDKYSIGDIMLNTNVAYQSARENRTLYKLYDEEASLNLIQKKIILSGFHKALSDREFYVVYQPKVGVKDRKLHGAEVLVRWRTSTGDLMPGSFVSILEQDGCICTLDFFMLEEVCKLLKMLLDNGLEPVTISVNFSKRHLTNNKLVEEIIEVIDRYGIPHDYIEVELTEGENSYNQGVMSSVVNGLANLGIKTSIDDFGTGYSSLGMLKMLNLDVLKIDKSFIPDAPVSEKDKSYLLLKGIISIAKDLGLTITAEGVETNAQFELIESLGCDLVQGFIFDRPLSESEFIDRIKHKDYVLD